MKVVLWGMGAPSDRWVKEGEEVFTKRIKNYMPFAYTCIQATKHKEHAKVLTEEAKWIQQQLTATPTKLILLDEKGPQLTSVKFSKKLDIWRQGSHKRVAFLIGSAYGFDRSVYNMADHTLGLASMTLPHQLCRLLLLEQLYRACTILRGESYHHE